MPTELSKLSKFLHDSEGREREQQPTWTEEPDRLQFVEFARAGPNLTTRHHHHRLTVECGEAQADSGRLGSVY